MTNRADEFLGLLNEVEQLLLNTHIHLLGNPYLGASASWELVMGKLKQLRGLIKSIEVTYTAVNKEP